MNRRSRDIFFNVLNRLAFWSLLASGAFVILLAYHRFLGPRVDDWIRTFIYLLPWVMLWPLYSFEVITNKARRIEIALMGSIIILGILNVAFSVNPPKSYEDMKLFLLTGVLPLWTSMFLLTDRRRRNEFGVFCCCCLVIVAPAEIISYLAKGGGDPASIDLFTINPIPTGTLMILLSLGPLYCLLSESPKIKIVGYLLLVCGLALIWMTQKRGTWISLMVMVLVAITYWRSKFKYYVLALLLAVLLLISWRVGNNYKSLDATIPSDMSILYRLEMYPFALHIFTSHPFLGIGLRPYMHEQYLADYQQRNKNFPNFAENIKKLQTFDNMLVTGFVELGSLMTLTYLTLIALIIIKYCRKSRPYLSSRTADFLILLPLLGFGVHSLTYDSLMFPQINWLFHVELGMLVGYSSDT
jgi:O-antigen ligase